DLENFLKTNLHYGDAGASILRIYILYGKKILDFSTLISYEQVLALAKIELKFAKQEEPIVILGQI
ncbi:MAG: hypothetical protein HYU63_06735, partial [Armatimonadetes bacterium]|nr:hypothetical protein [Armatimonadota bacterium]